MLLYHESDHLLVHCILGHYYHRRFLARLAQHCASTVPLRAKSTRNSAIYKLMAEICRCDVQFDHRPLTSPGYILWILETITMPRFLIPIPINGPFLYQFPLLKIAIPFLFSLCFPFLVTYSFFGKCLAAGVGGSRLQISPVTFISPARPTASPFHIEQTF
jgi:hypothetical protein